MRRVIRFGPFELQIEEQRLLKHGSRLKLQGQPFRVLCRLVETPQELVTRAALQKELWPGGATFVDFDHSLNEAVNKLRLALGDSAALPRYIETVPRHGYRFIGDVVLVDERAPLPLTKTRRRRYLAGAAIAALGLASGLALVPRRAPPASSASRSVAVLPFDNLSAKPEHDYLADGMTDELIAHLSKVERLRVLSRASVRPYRDSVKPLAQIGRELDVDHVIEGSVRFMNDRLRVTVHLDDVATGNSLWTQTYDGHTSDIFEIQDQAARALATKMRVELSEQDRERLATGAPREPAAYQAYLKGRHHWNQRTHRGLERAIDSFRQALELDPRYAGTYAGLADAYALSAVYNFERPHDVMPLAKQAAEAAIQLEPRLAEAHASLAHILFLYEWSWDEAEREFEVALELDPGYATSHQWYGVFLVARNRMDEGIDRLRHALERDPLSLAVNENLGWALYVARRNEEAIEQFEAALDLDPEFGQALRYLGLTLLREGRRDEARELLERAAHALAGDREIAADLALAHALAGEHDRAAAILDELLRNAESSYVSPYLIASFHTGLGNDAEALEWLERAYEERTANLAFLGVDPFFDRLRALPRFASLLERIGVGPGS